MLGWWNVALLHALVGVWQPEQVLPKCCAGGLWHDEQLRAEVCLKTQRAPTEWHEAHAPPRWLEGRL